MPDRFYRNLIETLPTGYAYLKVVTDEAGEPCDYIIEDVNEALAKILKRRKEELIGIGIGPQLNQISAQNSHVADTLKRVFQSRKIETITVQFTRIETWCKMSVMAEKRCYLVLFLTDITASMLPFFDLGTFFEITPDLLSISQPDGRYLRVNPAWTKTLGYEPAEIEGHYSKEFLHPEDLSEQKTIKNQLESTDTVINFVNRYRHKDGSYHFFGMGRPTHRGSGLFHRPGYHHAKKTTGSYRVSQLSRYPDRSVQSTLPGRGNQTSERGQEPSDYCDHGRCEPAEAGQRCFWPRKR